MTKTIEKIEKVKKRLERLGKILQEEKANLTFKCVCGKYHKIKNCDAIKGYYENENTGSPNGSFLEVNTLYIICPSTKRNNRMLIWNHEKKEQFIFTYSRMFKSVRKNDEYRGSMLLFEDLKWENNEYVDKNPTKFGL